MRLLSWEFSSAGGHSLAGSRAKENGRVELMGSGGLGLAA